MDKIKDAVHILNPGQVPVITADQPIYAIAKQIQWKWPDEYGEEHFVIMFCGLHIEMTALRRAVISTTGGQEFSPRQELLRPAHQNPF